MTKKELRSLYKQKRLALSATERMKLDDLLLIQLQRVPLGDDISLLLSYFPVEEHAEPNTHLFTRYIEHAVPHVRIAYSVIDFPSSEMHAFVVNDDTHFITNKYGIAEPEQGEPVQPDEIDVVFVPLLAFDESGYRVGFGKGFYDRFLTQCREDVITIGFSYFDAVQRIDDRNQYDVPLTLCITPQRVYEF